MSEKFDFGKALQLLKDGFRVRRSGWNGKGMWVEIVGMGMWDLLDSMGERTQDQKPCRRPWILMRTADDSFVPWLASQTDVLAHDWEVAPQE